MVNTNLLVNLFIHKIEVNVDQIIRVRLNSDTFNQQIFHSETDDKSLNLRLIGALKVLTSLRK